MIKIKPLNLLIFSMSVVLFFLILCFVPIIQVDNIGSKMLFVNPLIGNPRIVVPIGKFYRPIFSGVVEFHYVRQKNVVDLERGLESRNLVSRANTLVADFDIKKPYFETDTSLFNPRFESRDSIGVDDYLKRGLYEGEAVIQGWTLRYSDSGRIVSVYKGDYEIEFRKASFPKIKGKVVYFAKKIKLMID